MSITAIFVVFAVVWFLLLLLNLQGNRPSQAESGDVVEGTPSSAPAEFHPKRVAFRTTIYSVLVTIVLVYVIKSGWITLDMFDFYNIIEK
ncbi:hypothetical protein GCM10007939_12100 [Amylibacter marinus]|uniref:DUF1467 family protein n=1 Tax=Amylibacter marinus TaxID=1475483 RepID=A0ABQ5VUJ9_9RHOB|nr:DUF1467 family protein [Amylibacter marinus]GLQ34927.1 hypothetical protein GCM10007939_12100 [Amylibacter marinus]